MWNEREHIQRYVSHIAMKCLCVYFSYLTTRWILASELSWTINHKIALRMRQELIDIDKLVASYSRLHTVLPCWSRSQGLHIGSLPRCGICRKRGRLKVYVSRRVADFWRFLCVPMSWVCKKQAHTVQDQKLFHCTQVGLRMEGIPAWICWDTVTEVLQ